jgi:hypothetical protein
MYSIFYWIIIIILLLLSYVLYDNYMKFIFQKNNGKFESFESFENNDQPPYDLTQDSTKLDGKFEIFKDSKKYIKAPISNKCFKKQYSHRLLNPENKILPQVYFTDTNKQRSRIINIDVFKKGILDKIVNKYSNTSLNNAKYEELTDPKLNYFENTTFSIVNKDILNSLISKIKSYIDYELKEYVQNINENTGDIQCEKDMSNCETFIWKPGIIRVQQNESYYEYITQFTYYIQGKAFAYVLFSKSYVGKQNINDIYVNELNIMGLEQEQNIMLTPGYSKTHLDSKVNIFSNYPYTPYEANLTYYRSSNEETYMRDLFKDDEMTGGTWDLDQEFLQQQAIEREQNATEAPMNTPICMTEDGDVLNYSTKEECEAATDENGNSKDAAIFDNKCVQDSDCPFYLGNTNYKNTRGGCKDDGFCELPVNVQSVSYKEYNDEKKYYPYCYGCPIDKMDTCCEIQKKIMDGTATTTEIEEHRLTDVNLVSPDYAFENDFDERLNVQAELNERNIEVN